MRLNLYKTMADDIVTECMFTSGSFVSCITCFDETIEGEVIAFDYQKRLLILKSVSSNGQTNLNDVHWINLDLVKNVHIKKEVKREDVIAVQLPQININKVEQRAKNAIDERKKLAEAFNSGVSQDGVRLYLSLFKTIDGRVSWDGDAIVVMNSVKIQSPYKADNCIVLHHRGASPHDSVIYVKKLVDKYWTDQKQNAQKPGNSVTTIEEHPINNKG